MATEQRNNCLAPARLNVMGLMSPSGAACGVPELLGAVSRVSIEAGLFTVADECPMGCEVVVAAGASSNMNLRE